MAVSMQLKTLLLDGGIAALLLVCSFIGFAKDIEVVLTLLCKLVSLLVSCAVLYKHREHITAIIQYVKNKNQ